MSKTILLSGDNCARGRNGAFVPRLITVGTFGGYVTIEVQSRRKGDSSPVALTLNPDAALLLSQAISSCIPNIKPNNMGGA